MADPYQFVRFEPLDTFVVKYGLVSIGLIVGATFAVLRKWPTPARIVAAVSFPGFILGSAVLLFRLPYFIEVMRPWIYVKWRKIDSSDLAPFFEIIWQIWLRMTGDYGYLFIWIPFATFLTYLSAMKLDFPGMLRRSVSVMIVVLVCVILSYGATFLRVNKMLNPSELDGIVVLEGKVAGNE